MTKVKYITLYMNMIQLNFIGNRILLWSQYTHRICRHIVCIQS